MMRAISMLDGIKNWAREHNIPLIQSQDLFQPDKAERVIILRPNDGSLTFLECECVLDGLKPKFLIIYPAEQVDTVESGTGSPKKMEIAAQIVGLLDPQRLLLLITLRAPDGAESEGATVAKNLLPGSNATEVKQLGQRLAKDLRFSLAKSTAELEASATLILSPDEYEHRPKDQRDEIINEGKRWIKAGFDGAIDGEDPTSELSRRTKIASEPVSTYRERTCSDKCAPEDRRGETGRFAQILSEDPDYSPDLCRAELEKLARFPVQLDGYQRDEIFDEAKRLYTRTRKSLNN